MLARVFVQCLLYLVSAHCFPRWGGCTADSYIDMVVPQGHRTVGKHAHLECALCCCQGLTHCPGFCKSSGKFRNQIQKVCYTAKSFPLLLHPLWTRQALSDVPSTSSVWSKSSAPYWHDFWSRKGAFLLPLGVLTLTGRASLLQRVKVWL